MRTPAGIGIGVVIALALVLGLHACGGDDARRDRERCEDCLVTQVDPDCLEECRPFCAPGEDCEARCTRQCDRCKAELECRPCTSGCTGTTARCAPVDEPLTCDDGVF
jgi:hypothetical protein